MKPTARELVQSLRSNVCPACSGVKDTRKTFCGSCYRRCSPETKTNLYRLLGKGYEEAVEQALKELKVNGFVMQKEFKF